MNRFLDAIRENHLLENIEQVYVAVSGGSDSMALLHLFCHYRETHKVELKAIHIHHGLRKASDEEAVFVKEWCKRHQVPCEVRKVDMTLPELANQSVEERGRYLRYQVFENYLINAQTVIALAHHQDDQGETVLLNLFRGAGLKGLGGMLPRRGQYIRPLLDVPKSVIMGYIEKYQLPYMEDESNKDTVYTRNYLRQELMPMIEKKLQPKLAQHLGQTAKQLQAIENYLEKQTQARLEKLIIKQEATRYRLNKEGLIQTDPVIIMRIFRQILSRLPSGLNNITAVHHQDFMAFLLKGQTGKRLILPGRRQIKCVYQEIIFENQTEAKIEHLDRPIRCIYLEVLNQRKPIEIDGYLLQVVAHKVNKDYPKKRYTKWLDYDKIKNNLEIRTRRSGDFFYYNKALNKKKIKNYFIDLKMPKEKREGQPLLTEGKEILWIVGDRINERFKVGTGTKNVLKISYLKKDRT